MPSGGKRVPGPGKKLGRPRIYGSPEERAAHVARRSFFRALAQLTKLGEATVIVRLRSEEPDRYTEVTLPATAENSIL